MTNITEKFLEKNADNIKKLNAYVDENHDDIRMMIVSTELFSYIRECYSGDCSDYNKRTEFRWEQMKYKGIRMVVDVYSPVKRLYFVRKSISIDFNMPCNCGIFEDEIHP